MATSKNLSIGKGELYFAEFAAGTQVPGGERWIGNCPEFTLSNETEELEHFSSSEGRRKKDYSVVLENSWSGTISTDDMGTDNVTVFSLGVAETQAVALGATLEETFLAVSPGLTYQLGVDDDTLPEGLRKVTGVSVTDDEVTPATFTLNDDYTLDADTGRITIVEGGAIVEGTNVVVAYGNAAYSVTRVTAGADKKEGRLRFVSKNPDGPRTDYVFPWVKLGPNGDLNLISEQDWQTIPISVEVLEKNAMAPWYATTQPVTA